MFDDTPFDEVIEQLRRGEEAGANHVYHRFARRLYGLAQARLNAAVRNKVDPEDVVQSAFRSFFRSFFR
jgi:RNA polymerase sigma-70 factor (ECF subfamily)